MDAGARLSEGVVWVFTIGCPSDSVLQSFAEVTEHPKEGLRWIIIPVHSAESTHSDREPWRSVPAGS